MSTSSGPYARLVNTGEVPPKAKKGSHVRLVPPDVLFCRHCGERYTMAMPVSLGMFGAITKQFNKDHKPCRLNKKRGLACTYCFNFGHAPESCPRLDCGGDPREWWKGPDTGASSKALCRLLAGWADFTEPRCNPAPRDPDDFGRCHRLLRAIPGWRERVGEAARMAKWIKIAPAWNELEALYLEELPTGRAPRLFARLQELQT